MWCSFFFFYISGSTCTSNNPDRWFRLAERKPGLCMWAGLRASVHESAVPRCCWLSFAHLSAFAGQAGLFVRMHRVTTPLESVCACECVRVCACVLARGVQTESALRTQVKPWRMCALDCDQKQLWRPLFRPSSSLDFLFHHPSVQQLWIQTHSVSQECLTATTLRNCS